MARPKSIAREVAEATGMNLRTVQRVLAERPTDAESIEDRTLRRFIETLRGFATFCRDNDPDAVAQLRVTEDQSAKIRQWNDTVTDWLRQIKGAD